MKQFCCGQVVPGCQARFQGLDDDDLVRQVAAHARPVHGLHDLPPELVVQVRAALSSHLAYDVALLTASSRRSMPTVPT